MIVTKFGGSSLASASQFKKVKDIVLANPERKVVVVSAPGKRQPSDYKITDLLYILRSHIKYGVPDPDIQNSIISRYEEIETELNIHYGIAEEMKNYFGQLTKANTTGEIVSRGEYFCAKLFAKYLGYTFVDAADILFFTFDGDIDYEKSRTATLSAIEKYGKIVVPGFYGAYPNSDINVFSRGGSDITGAYMAAFLGAEVYENWTDVSGIYSCDPRIAKDASIISTISYDELRELSCMGANVLHEDSVLPCQEKDIPIHILNTNAPNDPGTFITDSTENAHPITGLAGKSNFVSFTVRKKRMSNEVGFVYRALKIFTSYNVSIEHMPTGMDTVSFIVEEDNVKSMMHKIVAELENTLDCDVDLENGLGMVAIVGEEIRESTICCSSVLDVLQENDIDLKCMVKAPDEVTMLIGVDQAELKKAMAAIYDGLKRKDLI